MDFNHIDENMSLIISDIGETQYIDKEIEELKRRKKELLSLSHSNIVNLRDDAIKELKSVSKLLNKNYNILFEYVKLIGIKHKDENMFNLIDFDYLNSDVIPLHIDTILMMDSDDINHLLYKLCVKNTYINMLLERLCKLFGHIYQDVDENLAICLTCGKRSATRTNRSFFKIAGDDKVSMPTNIDDNPTLINFDMNDIIDSTIFPHGKDISYEIPALNTKITSRVRAKLKNELAEYKN